MGWSWDHDRTGRDGWGTRSYGAHSELGEHLRAIAPAPAWGIVQPLWERRSDERFDIQAAQAGRMAEALQALAPLAPSTWQQAVYDLAASAREAARMGAVWHWS